MMTTADNVLVVVYMGSESDLPHVSKIVDTLKILGVPSVQHIFSAHKTPRALFDSLDAYEDDSRLKVYVTVAGRSNALSGVVDANVTDPVIACPPYSPTFNGADIYSSLRMPSAVAPLVVLEPASAALAAAKILSLHNSEIKARVTSYQQEHRERLFDADRALQDSHR